jgi:hypothetical protein
MTLKEEIKQEERSANKQTVWGGLLFGIIFLLLGFYLELNHHLQPFVTQVSSRYSSAMHDETVTPKSSAIACFILSFLAFLFSYGALRKIKMEKFNSNSKN